MATKSMVNNGLVNGLLPDGSYLNQYWLEMVMMIGIHPSAKNAHDMLAKKLSLIIRVLNISMHLQGDNELRRNIISVSMTKIP